MGDSGKDISTEQIFRALEQPGTFSEVLDRLGLQYAVSARALTEALRREKHAERIEVGKGRKWRKKETP